MKIEAAAAPHELYSGMTKHVARRFFHISVFLKTRDVPGGIAEFGVATGAGLAFWLNLQKEYGDDRKIWAIDSFQGFPAGTEGKDSASFLISNKNSYKNYTVAYVNNFLEDAGYAASAQNNVVFVPGFIPDSLAGLRETFSLVNLDLDLYQSTLDALTFVWPLVSKGGIIMIDEYDRQGDLEKWPGSKRAVDEFCAEMGVQLQQHFTRCVFLQKT